MITKVVMFLHENGFIDIWLGSKLYNVECPDDAVVPHINPGKSILFPDLFTNNVAISKWILDP